MNVAIEDRISKCSISDLMMSVADRACRGARTGSHAIIETRVDDGAVRWPNCRTQRGLLLRLRARGSVVGMTPIKPTQSGVKRAHTARISCSDTLDATERKRDMSFAAGCALDQRRIRSGPASLHEARRVACDPSRTTVRKAIETIDRHVTMLACASCSRRVMSQFSQWSFLRSSNNGSRS